MIITEKYIPWAYFNSFSSDDWAHCGPLVKYVLDHRLESEFNKVAEHEMPEVCSASTFKNWCTSGKALELLKEIVATKDFAAYKDEQKNKVWTLVTYVEKEGTTEVEDLYLQTFKYKRDAVDSAIELCKQRFSDEGQLEYMDKNFGSSLMSNGSEAIEVVNEEWFVAKLRETEVK